MKKFVSLIVLVLLIVSSLAGCSGNKKTEEELKAKIKAEMEAEAQQKEKLKEEIKAEMESEKKGSDGEGDKQAASNNKPEETASATEQEKPAFNNYQGNITVDASDLKVGDMINGHAIDKLTYKKGEKFGIGLKGEFTVTGEILYDDVYYGAIVLSTDESTASPTKIKFKFDSEFDVAPPSGTFVIADDSLNVVKSAAPNNFLNNVNNGTTYKVKLVINDYAFAAENHTSPGLGCNIVKVIDIEANNSEESNPQNDSASGPPSGFISETINGVQIGFNSDETVIVPMYNGANMSALESDSKVIGNPASSNQPMELNFAVFGTFKDVVVTYYEGMGSEGISTELGTFSHTNMGLVVFGKINDMSYIKVTGKVNGEASLIDVEFTIDDMRDPSDYEVMVF